mgnify:CR=1 FL=1
MEKLKLDAKKRTLSGRKVKRLRKGGILPANLYGKKIESQSIEVDLSKFTKTFKAAGETNIVELDLEGKAIPTLVHNIQYDPISDVPLHADFLQVNLKEKVVARIPVETVGESPAEKQGLGTVVVYKNEIEVEAFPQDLLDKVEIDLKDLQNVDDTVYIKDLKIDKNKIEVKDDGDLIVVKVEASVKEEAPVVEKTEEVVPGVIEGKTEAPQVEEAPKPQE